MKKIFSFVFALLLSVATFAQNAPHSGHVAYRLVGDIGSTGVKLAVLDIYKTPKGNLAYAIAYLPDQITLGLSKGLETNGGSLLQADIEKAATNLNEVFEDLLSNPDFKLTKSNIYLCASSGINKAKNIDQLDKRVYDVTGVHVDLTLTAEKEAAYETRASLDRSDFDDAVSNNVGGGNTKGGILVPYQDSRGRTKFRFYSYNIQFGAKRLSEKFIKKSSNFAEYKDMVTKFVNDSIAPSLELQFRDHPEIMQRNMSYISGGVAFQFVTWLKPSEYKTEIVEDIRYSDILAFYAVVSQENGLDEFKSRKFSDPAQQKVNDNAANLYSKEAVFAGWSLMKAVVEKQGNPDKKTYYFPRDAYWMYSYGFDKFKNEQ
jgi:exopolyphosphatase/pppGpp-phosphohydrolase